MALPPLWWCCRPILLLGLCCWHLEGGAALPSSSFGVVLLSRQSFWRLPSTHLFWVLLLSQSCLVCGPALSASSLLPFTLLLNETDLKNICVQRSPPMRSQIKEQDLHARLGSKTGKPYWGTIVGSKSKTSGPAVANQKRQA